MENDGMENNPSSRNVLRKDNSSLDYGKDSGINLHGVLHVYSGNSVASYAENSERQRHVFHALQSLFQAAIEKLRFPQEGPLRIADLGCATGINTVSDVDFVVKTLRNLWRDGHSNGGGSVAEFQAYFSDLPSNDFNGLFNLLDRPASPYFVAGVPGSFYNVLFPTSSIHVCFSVMALHWLSQVPQAIVQKTSPLYNKGRVWINRGSQDIAEAYSKQSESDLNAFINCRAQEMAPGGVIFLCMMGRPDSWLPTEQVSVGGEFCGQDFEDAWDELVTQGIISSDLRDSFNLPWYFPTAKELRRAVENCGVFEIESMQVFEQVPSMPEEEFEEYIRDPKMFGLMKSNLVKSFVGSLIEAHIGKKCTDQFFQAFAEKAAALLHCSPPSRLVTCTVSSLIRK
uniref:Uncharacterized protein n=1 Tax=Picea sitchensis TaxID=3332 RepID=A9NVY6_PICSI|nr:unknown [Picea sitchensis]